MSGKSTVYQVLAEALNLLAYREGEKNSGENDLIRVQVPGEEGVEKESIVPRDTGKTSLYGVEIHVIHPKSLTLGQLFGTVTNSEWQEGVLSNMIREIAKDTSGTILSLINKKTFCNRSINRPTTLDCDGWSS